MAIPTFLQVGRPLLALVEKRGPVRLKDLEPELANEFHLTGEERSSPIASGGTKFWSKIYWAKTYMKMAGLLSQPKRGHVEITEAGRTLLREHSGPITVRVLMAYPSFQDFLARSTPADQEGKDAPQPAQVEPAAHPDDTPDDQMERGYGTLRANLEAELLAKVREASPEFFERVVLDVLTGMGYGGSRADAAKRLGRSGDGGIDGTINEDPLGLETIYVQAKRWTSNAVGRPELQAFVGALQGHGARKGVFLTTSKFHENAVQYAKQVNTSRVVLIDGQALAALMVDHGVGVTLERTYDVKRLDSDYFAPE